MPLCSLIIYDSKLSHKCVVCNNKLRLRLWMRPLTHLKPLLMVAEWCMLGLEDREGVWLLGLRWGLCWSWEWDSLISIADGLPDTEGTDDADTEGTNFFSGGNDCI